MDEAAEFLRIPKETFKKKRREIGGSRLGRRLVFTELELVRWMESKREKPLSELLEN
jgi:hypothetical protein